MKRWDPYVCDTTDEYTTYYSGSSICIVFLSSRLLLLYEYIVKAPTIIANPIARYVRVNFWWLEFLDTIIIVTSVCY